MLVQVMEFFNHRSQIRQEAPQLVNHTLPSLRKLHWVPLPVRSQVLPTRAVLNNLTTNITEYEYSPYNFHGDHPRLRVNCFIGSCNGILCFTDVYKNSHIMEPFH